MKTWDIRVPISGSASVTVVAETEGEALEMAVDQVIIDDVTDWEPTGIAEVDSESEEYDDE